MGSRLKILPRYRPRRVEKVPPCRLACPNGGDIRRWIGVVAQRRQNGVPEAAAYERAWRIITEVNPFPGVLGRICPHPCEAGCNRGAFDEPLAINSMERFLGDWAIDRGLEFRALTRRRLPEKIAVVGAGPSGLSFAYQMARRGYGVTVYENKKQPGGMLRYAIPSYRLPKPVLDAEIARIVKLGVDIRSSLKIGEDITLDELRSRYSAVYVALGASQGRYLGVPGERGPGVWTGVEFLLAASRGGGLEVGRTALVLGGGSTAIDAARTARRLGARAIIAYRRSRAEMPAGAEEIEDALAEGVELVPLIQVVEVERGDDGRPVAAITRRTRLSGVDSTGRRRPVPVGGSDTRLPVDSVILAISQRPDLAGFTALDRRGDWLPEADQVLGESEILTGGDVIGLGIAGNAIVQGRLAAERLHERLRGSAARDAGRATARVVHATDVRFDSRSSAHRSAAAKLDVAERLAVPDAEVVRTISEQQFLAEAGRCASCGDCFGCEQCAMFCTAGCYERLPAGTPGNYFALNLDDCLECGKCIEACPCGFLETDETGI